MTFLAVTLLYQKVHRVCVGPAPAWCRHCGQTPGPAPNEHLISRLPPHSPGPALSLVSSRSQLFIFGWRWKCREIQPLATVTTIPRKPGQSRPEPSRDDQADQASSDRMKSWDDFVTVARAAGSATSHNNKNILYASSSSELGLSLGRVGLAFNPWDCNNNPAQYWPVWPGVICVQVFTWWGPGQAVLVSECSELPEPLIIAPCPVIVRLCSARLLS